MTRHPIRIFIHVGGVAGILVILGIGYLVGFAPLRKEASEQDILNQRAIELAKSLPAKQQQLEELKTSRSMLQEQLQALTDAFGREAGAHQLLAQYSELAEQSGATLETFQPQGGSADGLVQDCSVGLTVNGTYSSICKFLVAIDGVSRLQNVNRFQLRPVSEDRSVFQLEIHLEVSYGSLPQFVTHP